MWSLEPVRWSTGSARAVVGGVVGAAPPDGPACGRVTASAVWPTSRCTPGAMIP
jgi:hypothetical protein